MSVIETVNANRDLQATLNRAISTLVQLYTEKPHFIYELLQNAEDAEAKRIMFIENPESLVVMHDGRPFTERNLAGLTDIGLSDKLPETNKIGKFGVGFKSVFTICKDLYVSSEPSNWKGDIKGLYPRFSAKVTDFVNLEEADTLEMLEGYTTRFEFPYNTKEKFTGYRDMGELQETVAEKLLDIGNTTLLFLRNLKEIQYSINIPGMERSGKYVLNEERLSDRLTHVVSRGLAGDEEVQGNYYKFSRPVKIDNVQRSVDIAFKFEYDKEGNVTFTKPENGCISVYFPTGTVSGLNFIVQGPFQTTPNRSEVLRNSPLNAKLVQQVAFLLRQAILDLRDMDLVTADFLNMLPFNTRAFKHLPLMESLVETITKLFKEEKIFPGNEGGYWGKDEVFLARNNQMAILFGEGRLKELINDGRQHVCVSTKIKEFMNFDALYLFLKKEIGVPVLEPEDLCKYYTDSSTFLSRMDVGWLVRFCKMYSELQSSCFQEKKAATNMLTACFVKTADGRFVAPRRLDNDRYVVNIFRPTGDPKKDLHGNVVDPEIYSQCKDFFDDTLRASVPTDCDVFLADFAARYDKANDMPDKEHIQDVKKLLKYLAKYSQREDVEDLIKNHLKLRGLRKGTPIFRNPIQSDYYLQTDVNGDSLEDYFAGLTPHACFVDGNFYANHGISDDDLTKLGVMGSVVSGEKKTQGADQNLQMTWQTIGKYRHELMVARLPEVLFAIQRAPDNADSLLKSAIIYNALKVHAEALRGKLKLENGKVSETLDSKALRIMLNDESVRMAFPGVWRGAWLYSSSGELVAPRDIKCTRLDKKIYGEISATDEIHRLLGFVETKEASVKGEVDSLSPEARDKVFDLELEKRKKDPKFIDSLRYIIEQYESPGSRGPDNEEFPIECVGDLDRLMEHVLEMLAFADPVRFKKRVRSVKVSSIASRARTYLNNLYGFRSGRKACQLCHKAMPDFEAVEIFKGPELELAPMHLCLCPNCAAKYRNIREKQDVMRTFRSCIEEISVTRGYASDVVEFNLPRNKLWFTPLHFVEVKLLLEYAG